MHHFQARAVCSHKHSASTQRLLSVSIALEHSRGDDKRIEKDLGGAPRASSEIINY